MDKKELRAHILSRWQKLETERDPFIPQWKSIATQIPAARTEERGALTLQ